MAEPAKKTFRREYEDPIIDTMKKAAGVPEYQQMMDYLMARRAVPEMQTRYLGPGVHGTFTSGWGVPNRGEVRLTEGAGVNTLVHEITHAADRQLTEQYLEDTRSNAFFVPARTQFSDAFKKVYLTPDEQDITRILAPTWDKQEKNYRSSKTEAVAFGVADSVVPKSWNTQPAPPHVNATMATEFLILLDLAKRGMKDRPQSQGR